MNHLKNKCEQDRETRIPSVTTNDSSCVGAKGTLNSVLRPLRSVSFVTFLVLLLFVAFSTAAPARCWKTPRGIIVSLEKDRVCAMEAFGGAPDEFTYYSDMVNRWRGSLDSSIRLWNMIVPTSAAYYLPEGAKGLSNDQHPVIRRAYTQMGEGVRAVDVWDSLSSHVSEPIYARTDHHWMPLGAYYAARAFASQAGVAVPDTADYERKVIHGFNGTMGRWSESRTVKNTTEDFIWYRPLDSSRITTTYLDHRILRSVVSISGEPYESSFFLPRRDGSSGAYSTFMNGDARTTRVRYPEARSGRRLLIVKDSYGNALASFLLRSFDEVNVIDFRYFQGNVLDYITQAGITDVLIVNNLQHAYNPSTSVKILRLLEAPSTHVEEVILSGRE